VGIGPDQHSDGGSRSGARPQIEESDTGRVRPDGLLRSPTPAHGGVGAFRDRKGLRVEFIITGPMAKLPKLTGLKDWLTLEEAAQFLAATYDESVTKADVLRLVLDDYLKISVRLLGATYGECAVLDHADSIDVHFDEDAKIDQLEQTELFSLPMIGAERLSVEEMYQSLTGGPPPFFGDTDGTFLDDDWQCRYRLYSWGKRLDRLPEHALLVVRRDALDKFLRGAGGSRGDAMSDAESGKRERPMRTRERENVHAMITALCRYANLDIRQPSKVAAAIESETTRLLGNAMPLRTVQALLKDVRQRFGEQ